MHLYERRRVRRTRTRFGPTFVRFGDGRISGATAVITLLVLAVLWVVSLKRSPTGEESSWLRSSFPAKTINLP
jgi:hypothetical protein